MKKGRSKLAILLIMMVSSVSISLGCHPSESNKRIYENDQLGFSIAYPDNWELSEGERLANSIYIVPKQGLFQRHSAHIRILYLPPLATEDISLEESLEHRIESLSRRYDLDSVAVGSPPSIVDISGYQRAEVSILIPTAFPKADSADRQAVRPEPGDAQEFVLYGILSDDGRYLEVKVELGESSALNNQAEEIVKSISFFSE